MGTNVRVLSALSVTVISIVVSLVAAYVTFHYLQSSAEGEYQNFKLGGAFAAFIASNLLFLTFTVTIFNLTKEADIEKIRAENKELTSKLYRGAPCPVGFARETDYRISLTFSRPERWTAPPTQILYQFIDPESQGVINPNFNFILHNQVVAIITLT